MEAADLLRELKRNVVELAALHEIGKALTASLELPQVLKLIMEKVGELLAPNHYSLLLAEDSGSLRFEVAVGQGSEKLLGQRLEPGEGIAGAAAQSGAPILVADVRTDPRFAQRFDAQVGYETRSILALPLKVRDRCLGVIELVNGPGDRPFDAEALRTLAALGDYATIAIDNARNFARVQELTIVDEHTGLYNARHLRLVLEQEVRRAERFRHPLSLVFIDLDHFKSVNDNHGHLVGSELLREVGERLKQELRGTDVPTRYGGDEFAIVLPETSPEAGLRAAERLQAAIAREPFGAAAGLSLPVTASFGVATLPDHALTMEELLRAADVAMYRAKQLGRNRISVARPPTHGGEGSGTPAASPPKPS